nr:urease accessory protein G-like [Nicotiana tomentosiformis]
MASQDHHHHDHSHEDAKTTSWVGADGKVYHSHDGLAPHSHEPIYSPGYFTRRAPPLINRNFNERAFTIGIGGPVGTGYFLLSLNFHFPIIICILGMCAQDFRFDTSVIFTLLY